MCKNINYNMQSPAEHWPKYPSISKGRNNDRANPENQQAVGIIIRLYLPT